MNDAAIRTQNRRSLIILFAIGLVPVFVAFVVFFFFPQLMPTGTTNKGDLITPPVQAEALSLEAFTGDWILIVPVGATCGDECEERLYLARQVNVALGRESARVKRMVLWTSGQGAIAKVLEDYPNIESGFVSEQTLRDNLGTPDKIYLMDPLGNIFMSYTVEKAGKPMLEDIKHLLKISNIG